MKKVNSNYSSLNKLAINLKKKSLKHQQQKAQIHQNIHITIITIPKHIIKQKNCIYLYASVEPKIQNLSFFLFNFIYLTIYSGFC